MAESKKGPLTGKMTEKQVPDRWYGSKGAQANMRGDDHFRQLSERFWGFAKDGLAQVRVRDLGDMLGDLWAARVYILSGVLLAAVAATLVMLLAIPHTRVEMVISPAHTLSDNQVSAIDGGNIALLRMFIQRSGVDQSPTFTRFETLYKGVSVAQVLMQDERILRGVQRDRSFKFSPTVESWSAERLADYIDRHVQLEPVAVTSMRRMRYMHPEPAFARYFLARVHGVTDMMIREDTRAKAQERAAYLNVELAKARNPEHRRAMTDLLLEQERSLMLSSINQPYAASVVEPASSYYKAEWPDPILVYPLMILIGAFLGFVGYTVRGARD